MGATSKLFQEMREQINALSDQVLDGEINPFELGRELVFTKNCIEGAKDKISQCEKDEVGKYQPEELKNIKVKMAGGGYTYSFKHIPEWVKKNDELKEIEEKAKQAFQMSQMNSVAFSHEDGGEIIPAEVTPRKQSVTYL